MSKETALKIVKVTFITQEGIELSRETISEEQYQQFCDAVQRSRLEYGIRWNMLDKSE